MEKNDKKQEKIEKLFKNGEFQRVYVKLTDTEVIEKFAKLLVYFDYPSKKWLITKLIRDFKEEKL